MLLATVKESYSQSYPYFVNCFPDSPPAFCYNNSFLGGQCKPESIDRYTPDPDAVFRVLIVYVQFDNDPYDNVSWWLRGSQPQYFGELLSETKHENTNWWDAYDENTARMSDYWMEVSRGKFHVIGKEVHKILPHDNQWYIDNYNVNAGKYAMDDLYGMLAIDPDINWLLYDQWGGSMGNFIYGPGDGYVDMIYFIFRSSNTVVGNSQASFAPCTHYPSPHVIYNQPGREIKIHPALSEFGSGFQIMGNGQPLEQWSAVSFIPAEHGHYTLGIRPGSNWFGGHQLYGKVNNHNGKDEFFSPYEMIRLGYFQTEKVDYGFSSSYSIDDWTSRNNFEYLDPDEILEVPIGDANRNEFFLIVNRQKVSTYDKIMWGDTARGNPYHPLSTEQQDYGKGIYIYHAYPGAVGPGYVWQIPFDQECADGLFNHSVEGPYPTDWECFPWLYYYKKTNVVYNMNDNGGTIGINALNHDGKSVGGINAGIEEYQWLGIGGASACGSQLTGTDRVYSNLKQIWTSREFQGDRWDAWKKDYNEVFSPYSSPSTVNWSNENSGIFIYLESQSGTNATFKIYKGLPNTPEEITALANTPPSKPMLYRPVEHVPPVCPPSGWANPRIVWDNNLEPDMLRPGGLEGFKKYRIYRAISTNPLVAPSNYTYLATYDDYTPNDTANFIDNHFENGVRVYCLSGIWEPIFNDTYYRYKITAVDITFESVKSDFVQINAHPIMPDNPVFSNNGLPSNFSLSQNFPNPFNPSTQIKFALPQNTFVSVKVYNIAGELVATLVNNEYRNAGYYDVAFDGTNLASGIYFYKIEAGSFVETKKMVLIK